MGSVFPSVFVMDVPGTFNSIVYATVQPSSEDNLKANLIYLLEAEAIHPLLLEAVSRAAFNLQPLPASAEVFTDDRAPIEWITNNMVLNFVLFGDLEELQ